MRTVSSAKKDLSFKRSFYLGKLFCFNWVFLAPFNKR